LAHPKAPILCLHALLNSNLFASGGLDGRINLWQIAPKEQGAYLIEKVHEYSITKDETTDAISAKENNVQSVCIGSQYILAGTKSGDIYELLRPPSTRISDSELIQRGGILHQGSLLLNQT
jgi:hypothetical protein